MMRTLLSVVLLLGSLAAHAQDDLFGTTTTPARKGFVFGVNGSFDMPAGDMADRYGNSFRIGPSLFYKTTNNWMIGVKGDFITGSKIEEDSLMINIRDANGAFINQDGERIGVGTFLRGYMVGVQLGKIFPLGKKSNDNGLLVMTGVGFMQHKINIFDRDKSIPQLRGDYRKGYDRLTNGIYVEQFVGYNYFSKNAVLNFHIGLDIAAGFTQGRRDYLYDVRRTDNGGRLDILFGIRGGWYLPFFRRKSEEYFFE